MGRSHFLQSSMSPLARLGVSALVGVVLAGVPTARAFAAEGLDGASASDDDAPITALGEQLAARKRDAGERLRGLVQAALVLTAARVHEARDGMERVMALGYGSRRFEYVEGTDDPLAGL